MYFNFLLCLCPSPPSRSFPSLSRHHRSLLPPVTASVCPRDFSFPVLTDWLNMSLIHIKAEADHLSSHKQPLWPNENKKFVRLLRSRREGGVPWFSDLGGSFRWDLIRVDVLPYVLCLYLWMAPIGPSRPLSQTFILRYHYNVYASLLTFVC